MTVPKHRKIKEILFSLDPDGTGVGAPVQFECQIKSWNLTPPQEDGERIYTQCPDGEFLEDVEPVWTLELTFFADWKLDGISDFLQAHRGELAGFTLDHHPDLPDEHVQWDGTVKLKAPPVGGESRATEKQTVTMQCIGEPAYTRPPAV